VYAFTVSVSLKTDKNSYFKTMYDDRGIPPGTAIWLNIEFVYFDADETAAAKDVAIGDLHCE
jgi:hypothetical protein